MPLAAPIVASLAGSGRLSPGSAFAVREDVASPLAPWLLGIALAAAIIELLVRGVSRRRTVDNAALAPGTIGRSAVTGAPS